MLERAETLGNFALIPAKSGNWPEAISKLHEAIQVCGDCEASSLLHKDLGLIECRAGRLDDGEAELRIALRGSPADPDILRALQMLQEVRSKPAVKTP